MQPTQNSLTTNTLARTAAIVGVVSFASSILAIVALYFGLSDGVASLFLFLCGIGGGIFSLIAGAIALVKKRGARYQSVLALITGSLSLLAIVLLMVFAFIFASAMQADSSTTTTPSSNSDGSLRVLQLE